MPSVDACAQVAASRNDQSDTGDLRRWEARHQRCLIQPVTVGTLTSVPDTPNDTAFGVWPDFIQKT